MYKHSHECVNSKNKYSELEILPSLEVSGFGVSMNILKDSFNNYDLETTNSSSDDYDVEFNLINNESKDIIKGSLHDDCFFTVRFNNKEELKKFILGIINMHQEYIENFNGCIKEADISDEKIEEIIKLGKVSLKTIGSRVVIINKTLNVLEQKLPKFLIKDSSIIYG